ncbi:MAG TPA: methyltransferase [Candidatus Dormibacteraeota bacterium]
MPADAPFPAVSPERILMHSLPALTGAYVLATAAHWSLFTHLENGAGTVAALADRAGISERGAQALLDGVTGMGLVESTEGGYRNSPEASAFLVEGRPAYMGGFAQTILYPQFAFAQLPEAVRSGSPVATDDLTTEDLPMWRELVMAIVPLAMPLAQEVAEQLVRDRGEVSILDIGGGSGVYSAVLLGANPQATATQLDWPSVNAIAREFVGERGAGDRFTTLDGDFHTTDLGEAAHDVVVYSNIAHQESPEENVAVFRNVRRALRPGGVLVISDFVLDAEGRGHPFAGLFSTMMLLNTQRGASWRQPDYERWLDEAGFTEVRFQPTHSPATLIFAS